MIYLWIHNRTTCIAGCLFKTSSSLQLQFMVEVKQRKTLTTTVTLFFAYMQVLDIAEVNFFYRHSQFL